MTDTGYQAVIPMLAYEDAAAALEHRPRQRSASRK